MLVNTPQVEVNGTKQLLYLAFALEDSSLKESMINIALLTMLFGI